GGRARCQPRSALRHHAGGEQGVASSGPGATGRAIAGRGVACLQGAGLAQAVSRRAGPRLGRHRIGRLPAGQRRRGGAYRKRSRSAAADPATLVPPTGRRTATAAGRSALCRRPAAGDALGWRRPARVGRRLGARPAQVRHGRAADRGPLGGQGAGGMSSLFAFPGQGAQKPGMLHRLPDEPQVAAALAEAGEVLGEDALALDSAEALQSTRAVQLCLLIAGVAGARLPMRDGLRPDYVAGLSIGAYAAAVTAGAPNCADALRLGALRGELMQDACPEGFGMPALLGLDIGQVEGLLAQVSGPDSPVHLANINADNQLVVAGSDAAMAAVAQRAKALGASCARRLA